MTPILVRPCGRTPHISQVRRQRGLTLVSLLFIGVLVFVIGGAAVKAIPSFIEYRAIVKAVDRAAQDSSSPAEVASAFERSAAIDNITSLSGRDLKVQKANGSMSVSFEYEKRIPLAGNVSLVIDYSGQSKP